MLNNGKGTSHVHDDIISVENLLGAWREFVRGKRKKEDVQVFQAMLMDNILRLHADLKIGAYRHGRYEAFRVCDPKPRDIHKAMVRDRLVHHAIYRILYPLFDRAWIADSYSCRNDKGVHRAMRRFDDYAKRASKNNTRTCWVLKCDIKKFFASVDHTLLLTIVGRRITDPRTRALIAEVVGSFRSTASGKGLPLGNLTSQLLVNAYMNEFDQWVKHTLREKYYMRYADDFVVLSPSREHLRTVLARMREFLASRLLLEMHPRKVSIRTLASGIDFLGWVHFFDHRVLRTSTKRRMLRHKDLRTDAVRRSYRGLLQHGNAHAISAQAGL